MNSTAKYLTLTPRDAALDTLQAKIDALGAERSAHAHAGGDTLTCDIIHGAMSTLETAMAILAGEDDNLSDALACVRDYRQCCP